MTWACRICSTVLSAMFPLLGVAGERSGYRRIRERMQGFVDRGEIAGAVTLVGNADRILSMETVGRRDLEGGRPMQVDTVFLNRFDDQADHRPWDHDAGRRGKAQA